MAGDTNLSVTPATALTDIQTDFQTVQDIIRTRATDGTLSLQEARLGKMLSQTGSLKMFESLQNADINQLNLPEHDSSDPVARTEARLVAGSNALSQAGLAPPESEYRTDLDRTGVSNDVVADALTRGGTEGEAVLQAQLNQPQITLGNGSVPTPRTTEETVDALARQVETQIKEQPDWNEREYGALIYRNEDGDIKIGELTPGETVREAGRRRAPRIEFDPPDDLGSGEILGIVHNHPDVGYNSSEDNNNRNPSGDDWKTFRSVARSANGDEDTLSLYIVDSEGVMREFNKSDRRSHNGDDNPRTPDEKNDIDYLPDL